MNVSRYKLTLLLNTFPSYSISVFFSSIFIQPRLFAYPLLLFNIKKIKLTRWNLILLLQIFIVFFTPFFGLFFDRSYYLLDIAYFISAIYTLLFINKTLDNVNAFNEFIRIVLLINIYYSAFQIFCFYSGLSELTMLHSNIPFHVESGYTVQSGIFLIPRYTGLFIESGPLTFFLCLTFPYLLQKRIEFPYYLKLLTFVLIIFTQSKFLLAFLPALLFELIFKRYMPSSYKLFTNSFAAFFVVTTFIAVIMTVLLQDSELNQYLGSTIPAYSERLFALRDGIKQIMDLPIFGKGLLPTNFDVEGATFNITGLDAISIILCGYGLVLGSILLLSYLLFPVLSKMDYKFTFIIVLITGFISSGSLITPQYFFAITYSILSHYQNTHHTAIPIISKPGSMT